MKFLYKGDAPFDLKVPRNGGTHIDTVTVRPSEGPYETADLELVAAALATPDLFAPVDEVEPPPEETFEAVAEVVVPEKKKK